MSDKCQICSNAKNLPLLVTPCKHTFHKECLWEARGLEAESAGETETGGEFLCPVCQETCSLDQCLDVESDEISETDPHPSPALEEVVPPKSAAELLMEEEEAVIAHEALHSLGHPSLSTLLPVLRAAAQTLSDPENTDDPALQAMVAGNIPSCVKFSLHHYPESQSVVTHSLTILGHIASSEATCESLAKPQHGFVDQLISLVCQYESDLTVVVPCLQILCHISAAQGEHILIKGRESGAMMHMSQKIIIQEMILHPESPEVMSCGATLCSAFLRSETGAPNEEDLMLAMILGPGQYTPGKAQSESRCRALTNLAEGVVRHKEDLSVVLPASAYLADLTKAAIDAPTDYVMEMVLMTVGVGKVRDALTGHPECKELEEYLETISINLVRFDQLSRKSDGEATETEAGEAQTAGAETGTETPDGAPVTGAGVGDSEAAAEDSSSSNEGEAEREREDDEESDPEPHLPLSPSMQRLHDLYFPSVESVLPLVKALADIQITGDQTIRTLAKRDAAMNLVNAVLDFGKESLPICSHALSVVLRMAKSDDPMVHNTLVTDSVFENIVQTVMYHHGEPCALDTIHIMALMAERGPIRGMTPKMVMNTQMMITIASMAFLDSAEGTKYCATILNRMQRMSMDDDTMTAPQHHHWQALAGTPLVTILSRALKMYEEDLDVMVPLLAYFAAISQILPRTPTLEVDTKLHDALEGCTDDCISVAERHRDNPTILTHACTILSSLVGEDHPYETETLTLLTALLEVTQSAESEALDADALLPLVDRLVQCNRECGPICEAVATLKERLAE
ncbi:hypothetical protein KIPB_000756 [Kipferlia bialata]|uniref:RING-type domain-containing protein n=1 Tax=Kipferlia bialata TaxID=797122 RepID=A0A9K3CPJ2_9EUKA|nr:hypothetical protein KIPB_000756 [Kipferlia bialata]|eukprot:g756.t1